MPRVPLLLPLLLAAILRGQQPPQTGPEHPAAKQLRSAAEKLKAERYIDGIEIYQRTLDTAGDELVSDPFAPETLVPARWLVHRAMADMPAEGLRIYRSRVDSAMQTRLAGADSRGSIREYRSILADAFDSRPASEAIRKLAEKYLERGEIARASYYYSLLDQPHVPGRLNYPDARTPEALAIARGVVLKLLADDIGTAAALRERLRREHPTARGTILGIEGALVDRIDAIWETKADLKLPPSRGDWTSFAGATDRVGRIDTGWPQRWPDRPSWSFRIPSEDGRDRVALNRSEDHPRSLVFHPVIRDGTVYVADALRVFALRLDDGSPLATYDIRSLQLPLRADLKYPSARDTRVTLTIAEDRLLVRLGCTAMRAPIEGETLADTHSAIVRLPLVAAVTPKWLPDWTLSPTPIPDELVLLEGTPVVCEGLIFSLEWHLRGLEADHRIVAYRSASPVPVRVWSVPLGRLPPDAVGETRCRQELLGCSGHQVLYCGGGRAVSIDAFTGKREWEVNYAVRKLNRGDAPPSIRDLCPPIWADGRVFAAPNDSDRVMCIDAFTGRLLWEVAGVEVVHLVGVAQNKLIVAVGGNVGGLRAMNVETGSSRSEGGGWAVVDDGGLASFGRALLSDETIVWPTKRGLYFLAVEDGSTTRLPIPEVGGHLAFGDGAVVLTDATEVRAWIPAARETLTPARAQELGLSDPQRLFDLAEERVRRSRTREAIEMLREIRTRSTSPDWRLRAGLREAVLLGKSQSATAVGILEELLASGSADSVRLAGPDGLSIPASRIAVAELAALGRTVQPKGLGAVRTATDAERIALAEGYEKAGSADASRTTWPRAVRGKPLRRPPDWIAAADADTGARLLGLPGVAAETGIELPEEFVAGMLPLRTLEGSVGLPLCLMGRHAEGWTVRQIDATTRTIANECVLAFEPNAVVGWGGGLIALGHRGFARFESSRLVWDYRSVADEPVRPTRSTVRVRGDGSEVPRLDHFRVEGGRIFCIRDRTTLMAFDPETGEADWVRAFGNPSLPGVGAIDGAYRADGERLLIHQTGGKIFLLDSATGRTIGEYPGQPEAWTSPPLVDRNHRFLFGDGHEYLCATPIRPSMPLVQTPIPQPVSLTGESVRLRAVAGRFVAIVSRNCALEIYRIEADDDIESRRPLLLAANSVLLPCRSAVAPEIDGDATRLFVRVGDRLWAIDPIAMKVDWEVRLPEGIAEWTTIVGRDGLLLVPDRELAIPDRGLTAASAVGRALAAWRQDRSWACRIDGETGKIVGRVRIPDGGLIRRTMPIQNGWIVAGIGSCVSFASAPFGKK